MPKADDPRRPAREAPFVFRAPDKEDLPFDFYAFCGLVRLHAPPHALVSNSSNHANRERTTFPRFLLASSGSRSAR